MNKIRFNGIRSNEIQCKHKRAAYCGLDLEKPRTCNPLCDYCIKTRNYDFRFFVNELGEVPTVDITFRRRDNGNITEYRVKNVALNEVCLHVEREEWSYNDTNIIPIIEREFRLPLLPFGETYAEIKIIKKKLTKKEIEKEIGHEIDLL